MISGSASGSSTRQSSWRSVIPIPRPASWTAAGHVGEPDDDVAVDDLQVVGVSAMIAVTYPRPVIGSSSRNSAMLGSV